MRDSQCDGSWSASLFHNLRAIPEQNSQSPFMGFNYTQRNHYHRYLGHDLDHIYFGCNPVLVRLGTLLYMSPFSALLLCVLRREMFCRPAIFLSVQVTGRRRYAADTIPWARTQQLIASMQNMPTASDRQPESVAQCQFVSPPIH